jgi:hypothetical protein
VGQLAKLTEIHSFLQYSGKENLHLEQSIDDQLLRLFKLIRHEYTSSMREFRSVDFARLCQFLTLDIISAVAFGEPMGFLEHNEDLHGYIANQTAMLPIFEWFSTLPVLEKVMRLPGISQIAMPTPNDTKGAGLLMGLIFYPDKIQSSPANRLSGSPRRS